MKCVQAFDGVGLNGVGLNDRVAHSTQVTAGRVAPPLEAPLAASEVLRARRVAERVLSRSTREDLRRRGDLGIVLNFIGDRLRDSFALRVAVALLLLQLTVVPLVAWQLIKRNDPGPSVIQIGLSQSLPEIVDDIEVRPDPYTIFDDDLATDDVAGAGFDDSQEDSADPLQLLAAAIERLVPVMGGPLGRALLRADSR